MKKAVGLIIENEEGQILLGRRNLNEPENPATREAMEKIGAEIKDLELVRIY